MADQKIADEGSPKRYIYSHSDLEHFKASPVRAELLKFIRGAGRTIKGVAYDPSCPLPTDTGCGVASLYGSLHRMADKWTSAFPADASSLGVQHRFGNPAFRGWYNALARRSGDIMKSILRCHVAEIKGSEEMNTEIAMKFGAEAACPSEDIIESASTNPCSSMDASMFEELSAYLKLAFGHPIRLDYGTGHECSFVVFLFALFKIGVIQSSDVKLQRAVLVCMTEYLRVTRSIQTTYMLEPAGSHGVWGLDDYHCLAFYFGACQLISNGKVKVTDSTDDLSYMRHTGGEEEHPPSCVNDDFVVEELRGRSIYLGCIHFIKRIKRGAPFSESSPMLYDISGLPSWTKVAHGLLRLFEGEVLDKLPVVQHFVFGKIFDANWEPSETSRTAPTYTFSTSEENPMTETKYRDKTMLPLTAPWAAGAPPSPISSKSPPVSSTRAPWATGTGLRSKTKQLPMPPTKAPWAK